MVTKSCITCEFAMPIKGSDWVECRRYPPVGSNTTSSGFPTSPTKGWCGEFKKHKVFVQVTERV